MVKIKKKMIIFIILLTLLLTAAWIVWSNDTVAITKYEIKSDKIPENFSGFRIAQISDFHNRDFGNENQILIEKLKEAKPDIIVITGDFADSRRTDINICLKLANDIVLIAPTYYVSGNHESRIAEYEDLKSGLEKSGVTVLEDEKTLIEKSGENIALLGISDITFDKDYPLYSAQNIMKNKLKKYKDDSGLYTVMLAHRAELFNIYAESSADLVFSGHAHGGQVRLPFIGGILAPGQGFFPKYDCGVYKNDDMLMVVSRGIGNSIVPVRINNRPEIVVAELIYSKDGTDEKS